MNDKMNDDIDKYLELEDTYKKEQLDAFNWKKIGRAPLSTGKSYFYDHYDIPYIKQFESEELMLKAQIKNAGLLRYSCIGRIPTIRVWLGNFIPTMFGAELKMEGDHISPWILPVNKDLKDIVSDDLPKLKSGIFTKVLEYNKYFKKNMPHHFYIEQNAIGSPFMNATDLLGAKIYLEVIDRPHLVKQLLDMILNMTFEAYDLLFSVSEINNFNEYLCTGQFYNGIRVDGDSIVNLSKEMVDEFETPYLKKISEHYKAKVFYHYCDRPNARRSDYNILPINTISESGIICGINQMDFGYWYYVDSYNDLKRKKVSVNSFRPVNDEYIDDQQPGSLDYKAANLSEMQLEKWLYDMFKDTFGKSGIHIVLRNIHGIDLAKKVKNIWDSF